MELSNWIIPLAEALAWPLTALLLVWILKGTVADLVSRVTRISHHGTTIDVLPVPSLGDGAADRIEVDKRTQNAILSAPRASIIESWLHLELEIGDILEGMGISERPSSPDGMLHTLFAQGLVDDEFYGMLVDMKVLRDRAAHNRFGVSSEEARRYAMTARGSIALLRRLASKNTVQST